MTNEDGTVVKERECLGRCGEHGHQISYGGENLTAYFCRPRRSRRDEDSDIEGIREHYEDFMIDLHDLWDSEFGDDWWSDGGDGDDRDDEDWWGLGDDDEDDDFGDDDDDSWWPFGDNDGGNHWRPSGGHDDVSWWDFEGSADSSLDGRPQHPRPGGRPTEKPDGSRPVPRPSQWPLNLECWIVLLASVLLFWIFDITWAYSSENNPSLLSEATQSLVNIFVEPFTMRHEH